MSISTNIKQESIHLKFQLFWQFFLRVWVSIKYDFFDNKNKEYVIEQPDIPDSWINPLGVKKNMHS